jgi:hypothetical protein
MQALMNQGDLTKDMIGKKLITFGVSIFHIVMTFFILHIKIL